MPFSRPLIVLVACLAGLVLPAAAGAQTGKVAKSHVIKTPKGNQLAVPITVRYQLDGKGKSLKRSRLNTRVAVRARLRGGRVVRAVERRNLAGKARVKVEHHPFFSVAQTRALRRALAAKQKVRLAVTSTNAADLNRDGRTDARSTQKSALTLAAPSAEKSPAPVRHQQGDDPCGALGLGSATCANVTGSTWTARHFWAVTNIDITCPSAFPYSAASVAMATTSKHYTLNVGSPSSAVTRMLIGDDNVSGHPITYTPTAACTTTNTQG